jgi:hypothetical protein
MKKRKAIPTFEVTNLTNNLRKVFKDERKAVRFRDELSAIWPTEKVRVEEWHGVKHMRSF